MPKPKRYRWNCPQCGSGKLLGKRPKKNATGRYCLVCSEKTGYLVERVCSVLESKRTAGRQRSVEKQKRKHAKANEKYLFDDGRYDVRKMLRKVWKIACLEVEPEQMSYRTNRPPKLVIRYSGCGRGWADWYGKRILIGRNSKDFGKDSIRAITETVIHEVAHFVAHARGATDTHGDGFRGALIDLETACREAGIEFKNAS